MDLDELRTLDRASIEALGALTRDEHRPPVAQSNATPHPLVCSDGRTYWVKSNAQQGLVAELVCGRLAAKLEVGPAAAIIDVPAEALPADGSANNLIGLCVGSRDVPNAVNARDLGALLHGGQFDPAKVDAKSRGAVVVFQSWLGVHDSQVMLDLTTGRVSTIDHGDCFGDLALNDPAPIVTAIPGVDQDLGRRRDELEPCLKRVEDLADDVLLESVSRVPDEGGWRADEARRLEIAKWLAFRRDRLGSVLRSWAT